MTQEANAVFSLLRVDDMVATVSEQVVSYKIDTLHVCIRLRKANNVAQCGDKIALADVSLVFGTTEE